MTPEFLICLECETPCYVFEWKDGEATAILCEMCGNEDPEQFLTDEDFDQLAGG